MRAALERRNSMLDLSLWPQLWAAEERAGIAADILHAYRRRFPEDRAATSLAKWQLFENEHPDTFVGMYQFWIQKAGSDGP